MTSTGAGEPTSDEDEALARAVEHGPEPAAAVPALDHQAALSPEESVAEERAAVERQADASG